MDTVRPDDVADPAAAAPVDAPAAPAGDDLDAYIKEFEGATAQPVAQPEQPITGAAPQPTGDALDQLLAELSQPTVSSPLFTQGADAFEQLKSQEQLQGRLDVLQSENAQLKQFVTHQRDVRDFNSLAAEVQSKLGRPDLPNDYAETQLLALAINNPVLQQAFDYRGVDPRLAAQELRQIEIQLNQTALPAQREMLQQYAQRLNIAINSKSILRRAMIDVEKRAEAHKPLDEIATADHDAVAAAVRGSSGKAVPERAPDLGNLSDKEFARYTRQTYGF